MPMFLRVVSAKNVDPGIRMMQSKRRVLAREHVVISGLTWSALWRYSCDLPLCVKTRKMSIELNVDKFVADTESKWQ